MLLHGIDRLKKITIGSSYVTDLRYTNYVHYRTYTTVVPVQYMFTRSEIEMSPTRTDKESPIKNQGKKKKNRKRKKHSKKPCDEGFADRQNSEFQPAKMDAATSQQKVAHVHVAGEALEKIPAVASKAAKQQPNNNKGRKKRTLSQEIKYEPVTNTSTATSTATSAEGVHPRYSFQVDDTDHCETPLQAYRDALDVLDRLAKSLNKKRSTLRIYDPYYCDGGVKLKLASYGFTSVINRNRDFYDDIDKKATPEYDVLVTNPPYSGVHMEKILAFCSESSNKQKPFLLLLPHFVYTKDYYQSALSSKVFSSMFFLVPEIRYSYIPPAWVEARKGSKALEQGKSQNSPFPSFWYCHAPKEMIPTNWLMESFGPSGMIRPKHHSKLRYATCSKDIPRDFKGEFDTTKKRANPRARKKAAKKRQEAAMRAGTSY